MASGPVRTLSINDVVPQIAVEGPAAELADDVRASHAAYFGKRAKTPPNGA